MKVTVVTTPQAFPAGTVAGALRCVLTSAAVGYSSSQDGAGPEFDFPDATAPDDYTATVTRLDATGNALGSPATGSATIPQPAEVDVDVPSTVTVTLD